MAAQDDVRKASQGLYAALNRMLSGDAGPLSSVWSHEGDVTAMHPIGGRNVGWDDVRGSFEQVAHLASGGQVALADQRVQVGGDLAYEVGVERGHVVLAGQRTGIEHRVTNVYRREGGTWKLVHHHTDVSPDMMEVLARLQGRAASAGTR